MPDRRKHRGPHQADPQLFTEATLPRLRQAVSDLSWLLERGYRDPSALKLVGDRHGLRQRQREAVRRAACSDAMREVHARGFVPLEEGSLASRPVSIDGFNCVVTVEAALSGGVILRCRDGRLRDIASVHGSYRKVSETESAATLLGGQLARAGAGPATWYLDSPVSNSGRLRSLLLDLAERRGWDWSVELVTDPDVILRESTEVCATNDGGILDVGVPSIDLPAAAIAAGVPGVWLVDLATS